MKPGLPIPKLDAGGAAADRGPETEPAR
jgi:hypothetical protein